MHSPVKWAGGKSFLFAELDKLIDSTTFDRYVDPFCGSIALPLHKRFQCCWLNDINMPLVNMYEAIRDQPQALIDLSTELLSEENNNQQTFGRLKQEFNTIKQATVDGVDQATVDDVEQKLRLAGLFLFLNKRGFNGLYRENSSGLYNVPYRSYKTATLDAENVMAVHEYMSQNEVRLTNLSYAEVLQEVTEGDLVYIDPPYYPTSTSSFTGYWRTGFTVKDQEDLCLAIRELDARGAKFIMSNSPCQPIKELYHAFNMKELHIKRQMRSGKGKTTHNEANNEILVWNF